MPLWTKVCRKCGESELVRSRRNPLERLLPLVLPYRCVICGNRMLRLKSLFPEDLKARRHAHQ